MARTYRLSLTAVVIVCLLTSTVAASEPEGSSIAAASRESVPAIDVGESIADVAAVPDRTHATRGRFSFDMRALHFDTPVSATRFVDKTAPFRFSVGQIVQGPPYPYPSPPAYHVRHDGSIAALMIGAAAAIMGSAVLIYAETVLNAPLLRTPEAAGTARRSWAARCWPAGLSACSSAR